MDDLDQRGREVIRAEASRLAEMRNAAVLDLERLRNLARHMLADRKSAWERLSASLNALSPLQWVGVGFLLLVGLVYLYPLFWLLDFVHKYVGNWGLSIMLVTLLLKLAFYKLSETSGRSAAITSNKRLTAQEASDNIVNELMEFAAGAPQHDRKLDPVGSAIRQADERQIALHGSRQPPRDFHPDRRRNEEGDATRGARGHRPPRHSRSARQRPQAGPRC